jgi:hypothetical protein
MRARSVSLLDTDSCYATLVRVFEGTDLVLAIIRAWIPNGRYAGKLQAILNGCWWPVSDIHRANLNGCTRGIAAVGSVKLSGSKASIAPTHDSQRGDRFLRGWRFNTSEQCPSGLIPSRTD